ncbi:MAG TPA: CRISPR-associated protein Cas4 [Candidatus Hydrogenedentes bacterium]|nr:CRISPR-associated protein Cas4 [Candidatus Hydrogenedentota bacterium]HPG70013.1 CRISPR-associated protein Cas4 [Candidatus Hydrogenedentota bacterium]
MYTEDDLLPLSGLQHLIFCARQWALIHIEGAWAENRLTVEGRHLHERVHETEDETRDGVRIARGLRLHSFRLGLIGQADVVEFHPIEHPCGAGFQPAVPEEDAERAGKMSAPQGSIPFPVEYKRGRPKPTRCDEVQVCAQAMCLEEMLHVNVPRGAIYYGQPRRRHEVIFDDSLRAETEALASRMHALFNAGETPSARYEPKCDHCSLIDLCLPKVAAQGRKVGRYLEGLWNADDVAGRGASS